MTNSRLVGSRRRTRSFPMTAQVTPLNVDVHLRAAPNDASSFPSLIDRLLESVTCCASSTEESAGGYCHADGFLVGRCDKNNNNGSSLADDGQTLLSSSPLMQALTHESNDTHGSLRPESILPHLRFQPLPLLYSDRTAEETDSSDISSLNEFYRLFLADDAPHSFLKFHEGNGEVGVNVSHWRHLEDSESNTVATTLLNCFQANGSTSSSPFAGNYPCTKMERSITFTTKIKSESISSSTVIPVRVVNTQTLSKYNTNPNVNGMSSLHWKQPQKNNVGKMMILENEFKFDFDNHSSNGRLSVAGLSQLLVSNDVRGSTVNVRVILREGDDGITTVLRGGTRVGGNELTLGKSSLGSLAAGMNYGFCGSAILEGCRQEEKETLPTTASFLSWFTHPLLLPPDSLCGTRNLDTDQSLTTMRTTDSTSMFSKSFPDSGGVNMQLNSSLSYSLGSPAHIGASLLSEIKAKNSASKDAKDSTTDDTSWSLTKHLFNNSKEALSTNTNAVNNGLVSDANKFEYQEDVLSCSSRGSLKLKQIPSFEFVRAPSSASASEGHMAMRRMILERDGVVTSSLASSKSHRISQTASYNNAKVSPIALQALSMRIEMELRTSPSSSSSLNSSLGSLSRSRGSITSIDEKIKKNLKKRVSRSWISWAESWCMRFWEEEESDRIKRRAAEVMAGVDGRGGASRKRKTNVRPTVRRIGEAGKDTKKSSVSALTTSMPPSGWHKMDVDEEDQNRREQWMFVGESSSIMKEMELEECGVEVSCTIPAPASSNLASKHGEKGVINKQLQLVESSKDRKNKRGRRLLKTLHLDSSMKDSLSTKSSRKRIASKKQVKMKNKIHAAEF